MSILPCQTNPEFTRLILDYAETLKAEAHLLGDHGLDEQQFYASGLFRGAIERIRGQFSATMTEKRDFARRVLNRMQDTGYIQDWEPAGDANRYDYVVTFATGRTAAIELKGCLDGNNVNIFERPPQAQEFIIWSVCSSPTSDIRHNVWSGINRLGAEIVSNQQRVDGLVIWDWICGTAARACPKIIADATRLTEVGQHMLTPPCIYVFPGTVPHVRNNPTPTAQALTDVQILNALHRCFNGRDDEVNYVDFEVGYRDTDTMRKTRVSRGGEVVKESPFTKLRRT